MNVTLTLPPVDQMLEDVYRWTIDNDNSLYGRYVDDNGNRETYKVPDALLAERHPLLPKVIRAIHDFNSKKRGDTYAAGATVNLTLFYLEQGSMRLPCLASGEYHDFASISELGVSEHEPDTITVKGLHLSVLSVSEQDVTIPFVAADNILTTGISRAALDRDFPGWYERFVIGQELGLFVDDLSRYMFTNGPVNTPPADVPTDVAFE